MGLIWRMPVEWRAAIGAGIMVGLILVMIGFGLAWYVRVTTPGEPILVPYDGGLPYKITQRPIGGAWLEFHFNVDPSTACVRETVHQLSRERPGQPIQVFPLSSGISGQKMSMGVSDYSVLFLLPVDFPDGDWQYTYRAHYGCGPLELIPHTQKLGITIHVPPQGVN